MYLRPSRSISEWLGPDLLGSGKPHRAVLWLPGTPADWAIPETWTHPDVIYETIARNAAPDLDDRDRLIQFLEKTDESAALPIDFILTTRATKALAKAARRLSIPLISLP